MPKPANQHEGVQGPAVHHRVEALEGPTTRQPQQDEIQPGSQLPFLLTRGHLQPPFHAVVPQGHQHLILNVLLRHDGPDPNRVQVDGQLV